MSAPGYCEIGGCGHEADGAVSRNNEAGMLRLCAGHLHRWLGSAAALSRELAAVERRRRTGGLRPSTDDVNVISERVELLAERIRGGKMAGARPQPGTAKALDGVGRGEDKRRECRRRP